MGLEDDRRAGGVRIDPNSIVAKAGDLTPNIAALSEAFNRGFVQTQDIMDRFSKKTLAEEEAATAQAKLVTRDAQEVGPLQIEARKSALSPEIVAGQAAVQRGQIDEELANQDLRKKTRKQRDKLFEAQVGQALDEMTQHLPAATVAQLNHQFPQLGAEFDDNGRVSNPDAVKARLPAIVNYQRFLDSAQDLSSQFDTVQVALPDGNKGVQTVWKGTNRPVPQEIVDAAVGARQAKFGSGFSPGGSRPAPGQFAGASPATPGAAAPEEQLQTEFKEPDEGEAGLFGGGGETEVGQINNQGILVTGKTTSTKARPTEVESRANKFFHRMNVAEDQYTSLLRTGYDPASPRNVAARQGVGFVSKVPFLGPAIAATGAIPPEAYEIDGILKSFTSAMLRDESGAAIRNDEREEYERMVFPVAGEPKRVSRNKAELRASVNAALQQVAKGELSEEAYEEFVESVTGRQFPIETSVRSATALGEKAVGGGEVNETPTPEIDTIPSAQPGQPVPEGDVIRFNGRFYRRKKQSTVQQAPAEPSGDLIQPRGPEA